MLAGAPLLFATNIGMQIIVKTPCWPVPFSFTTFCRFKFLKTSANMLCSITVTINALHFWILKSDPIVGLGIFHRSVGCEKSLKSILVKTPKTLRTIFCSIFRALFRYGIYFFKNFSVPSKTQMKGGKTSKILQKWTKSVQIYSCDGIRNWNSLIGVIQRR